MNAYQSDQWLSSSLFSQQPTDVTSMDMSTSSINNNHNENKIEDLEQLTLHWNPSTPIIDRRRSSFAALLSDILPNHNHNHTQQQPQSCNSMSTTFECQTVSESLDEMESSLTTAPDSDELARAELMLHQMDHESTASGFNTKQPKKSITNSIPRSTPSPPSGVRTGSPAGKKPAFNHRRTNSGGAVATARKIKKEQLHNRQSTVSPSAAPLPTLPQITHAFETTPTSPASTIQRRPAASDPINAFLPADKAEILNKDHKPARGRGRTAQLQQMTQEQIEAEADARVEKNRQAARECRAKRKQQVGELRQCVQELEQRHSSAQGHIQQLQHQQVRSNETIAAMASKIRQLELKLKLSHQQQQQQQQQQHQQQHQHHHQSHQQPDSTTGFTTPPTTPPSATLG